MERARSKTLHWQPPRSPTTTAAATAAAVRRRKRDRHCPIPSNRISRNKGTHLSQEIQGCR